MLRHSDSHIVWFGLFSRYLAKLWPLALGLVMGFSLFPSLEGAAVKNLAALEMVSIKEGRSVEIASYWLDKFYDQTASSVRARYLLGVYYLWLDDPVKAQAVLETGSGFRGYPLAGWVLAEALISQRRLDEAARVLAKAGIPTDTLVRWGDENWSFANQGSGNDVLADLYFSVADSQGDGSPMAWRSLGRWWLYRREDSRRALDYLLAVVARNPRDPYALFLVAEAYKQSGDIDHAIEYMERSDQLYGDRMPYRPQLAQMYLIRSQPGDVTRARDALEPFITRYPDHELANQLMKRIQTHLP